jgi:hypothetical protein
MRSAGFVVQNLCNNNALQGNHVIHVKDHKQRDMFNPFAPLGTKRLVLLEPSWAHLFWE